MTIGLDLSDKVVRSLVVDDAGTVVARAERAADAAAIPGAVRDVLRKTKDAAGAGALAGVAMPWPGDEFPAALASLVTDTLKVTPKAVAPGPAMALAESWVGGARGRRNIVTFSLGEHVNAGLMVNGAIWRGVSGHAGSVGWLALNPVEREDYRRYGGLEAEVSAAGIVRRLVWRIKSGDHSQVIDEVSGDLHRLTTEHVFAAARAGDGVCVSVVRDTAKYVGMALSNLAVVLDPETIILGGTLASAGDLLFDPIRVECSRRLRPAHGDSIRIELSTLGDDVVAIGAARAATV